VGDCERRTRVVSTINSAILCASSTVGARFVVPGVAVIAVGVSARDVSPAPVGVEDDGARLGGAASASSASASLPGQLRVGLGCRGANLLSAGGSEERERCKSESPVHDCCCKKSCCWMLIMIEAAGRYLI
jgi:hypothetical protein